MMMGASRSDQELLEAVRAGDDAAYGELWSRHADAAVRAARQFDHSGEAEDIVAEAFTRILAAIRTGGGPATAFRPYLFRTVSNLAQRSAQHRRQAELSGDETVLDEAVPFSDPLLEGVDQGYAVRAYHRLGQEQQAVVWYVDIEGLANTEAARLLGTTPTAVGSMAHRAREALRREFLQAHIDARRGRPECRQTLGRLGAYVRGTLTPRARQKVEAHLDRCDECGAALDELAGIAASLRAELLPLVLGPAAYSVAGQGSAATAEGGSRALGAVAAASAVAMLVLGALAISVLLLRGDASREPGAEDGDRDGRGAPVETNWPVSPAGEVVVLIHPRPSPPVSDETPDRGSTGDGPPTATQPVRPADQPPMTPDRPVGPTSPVRPGAPGESPDSTPWAPAEAPTPEEPAETDELEPPGEAGESEEPEPDEPERPEEPEPEEPEPELLPPLRTTWRMVADEAWEDALRTYFVIDIVAADPGEQVGITVDSSSPAGFSPIVGHLPAEPPLTDDGVWDCGDSVWRPQQDCSAVADDVGRVTAVFAVATSAPDAVIDVEITGEGREPHAVMLRKEDGCLAPDECEAPEPPGDHPDEP